MLVDAAGLSIPVPDRISTDVFPVRSSAGARRFIDPGGMRAWVDPLNYAIRFDRQLHAIGLVIVIAGTMVEQPGRFPAAGPAA